MKTPEQNRIFEDWLSRYQGLMLNIVRGYAFGAMDRDDLFQEIAVQVWRSIPSFRQRSSESTWIYRVALNTAIKWIRKERKSPSGSSLDGVEMVLNETGSDERLEWLYEEIRNLNEIDRSIVLLLLDDFSYKEMASILGITESNVGVKINRIKKHFITKSKNNL